MNTYSFVRYIAGKPVTVVAAKAITMNEAVSQVSKHFTGIFLLVRKR